MQGKIKNQISISLCSSVDQFINIFYGNKKVNGKNRIKKTGAANHRSALL